MGHNIAGGCACGAIRYTYDGTLERAFCCHCRQCQKASGSAMIAAFVASNELLRLEGEKPTVYASTGWGRRHFCGQCGSPLFFTYAENAQTSVVMFATLDAPEAFAPRVHIWTEEQAHWLVLGDELPQHLQGVDG